MFRSKNRFGGKAPTFAVLVDRVGDAYQCAVLRGVMHAATAAGANLLCFAGGELPMDPSTPDVRHRVYDLVGPSSVDGVILLGSTLSHSVGTEGLVKFCGRFRSQPLCNIGAAVPGVATVTVNNEAGMRAVVLHLIREHGARRLAFVRGPLANVEAELRLRAYKSALEDNGIAFDERLVVTGDFTMPSGEHAVSVLVDERGVSLEELDGIVSSNDTMALGILGELGRRGVRVPADLALVGFDDIEEACLLEPPLTTVRQPFDKQGGEGLHIVLGALRGSAAKGVDLETEPTVRRSCGCAPTAGLARRETTSLRALGFDAALLTRRQHVLDVLTRAAAGAFVNAGSDWQGRLLSALVRDVASQEPREFSALFQDIVTRLHRRGVEAHAFDAVLGALRQETIPLLRGDAVRSERAEDVFHQARLVILNTMQRMLVNQRLRLGNDIRSMTLACNALAAAFEPDELTAEFVRRLPPMGFAAGMLVLYERSPRGESARLLVGYDAKSGRQWVNRGPFDPRALLPSDVANTQGQGRSFMVMPLAHRHELYGHLMLELESEQAFAYAAVTEAVTTAVRGARVLAQVEPESGMRPVSLAPEAPVGEAAPAAEQGLGS